MKRKRYAFLILAIISIFVIILVAYAFLSPSYGEKVASYLKLDNIEKVKVECNDASVVLKQKEVEEIIALLENTSMHKQLSQLVPHDYSEPRTIYIKGIGADDTEIVCIDVKENIVLNMYYTPGDMDATHHWYVIDKTDLNKCLNQLLFPIAAEEDELPFANPPSIMICGNIYVDWSERLENIDESKIEILGYITEANVDISEMPTQDNQSNSTIHNNAPYGKYADSWVIYREDVHSGNMAWYCLEMRK